MPRGCQGAPDQNHTAPSAGRQLRGPGLHKGQRSTITAARFRKLWSAERDSLKAFDPKRPIREADIGKPPQCVFTRTGDVRCLYLAWLGRELAANSINPAKIITDATVNAVAELYVCQRYPPPA